MEKDSGLNIRENRAARKYSRWELAARVLWGSGKILFWLIPRPAYRLRNVVLRLFGARIGRQVQISNTVEIFAPWNLTVGDYSAIGNSAVLYNLAHLQIGSQVTISQRAHLCGGTHDYRDPSLPLKKCEIFVADQAWICADAFVGPNVKVAEGAIVGARAVAIRDVEKWTIVAGNPATFVKLRELATQKQT